MKKQVLAGRIWRFVGLAAIFAIFLLTATACVTTFSEEEREAEFREFYNSEVAASKEQRQAEFEVWLDGHNFVDEERGELRALFSDFYNEVEEGQELTREERLSEFIDLYASTENERTGLLKEVTLNGGHDQSGLTLALLNNDAREEVTRFTRQIHIKVKFVSTLDEAVAVFGDEVKDAKIAPDGTVVIPVGDFESKGVLGPEHVLGVVNQGYLSVCSYIIKNVEPDTAEKFSVDVFILPRVGEASWKTEKLFSGSAMEMCFGGEGAPRYYEKVNAVVFKRPELKTLPVPETDLLSAAQFSNLDPGGNLLYATDFGAGVMTWEGKTLAVLRGDSLNPSVMFFVGIPSVTPAANDLGSPVYYVERDADNPVRLIGFIIEIQGPVGIVAPADYILNNIEEFSYEEIE